MRKAIYVFLKVCNGDIMLRKFLQKESIVAKKFLQTSDSANVRSALRIAYNLYQVSTFQGPYAINLFLNVNTTTPFFGKRNFFVFKQ